MSEPIAVNDQTGEVFVLRNGQWVPEEEGSSDPLGEMGRQLGLTARHLLAGTAKIGTGINDAVNMGVNQIADWMGSDYRQQMTSPMVDEALDKAGLPKPQGRLENAVGDASQWLAGASVPIGLGNTMARAGSQTAQNVGRTLAANPGLQAASAATGGATYGATEGMNEAGRQLLALGASLLPGAAQTTIAAGGRGIVRGTDPTKMRGNIADFKGAGTTPSVGQATQNGRTQYLESLLGKVPGGAGRMRKFASQQLDDVGAAADDLANRVAPKATSEKAGIQVEKGINGFVDNLRAKASGLYDDIERFMDTSAPIELKNTRALFGTPSSLSENAPNTAKRLGSAFMRQLGDDLDSDLAAYVDANGFDGLPYSAVKQIRSAVGRRMGSPSLADDAPKAELKRLYAALTEDMTAAARKAGPQAARAADRARNFYRAGEERIERLEKIIGKKEGEQIFKGLMTGTNEGATRLRTVFKSLQPDERKWVTANVIRRMGKATPGNQDAEGEAFSLSTYLTNWNRLSPEAKNTLMQGRDVVKATDQIARVAANTRDGSKVFANASGTTPAAMQAAAVVGVGASALTAMQGGSAGLSGLALIAGTTGGANLAARLMTNPRFVTWLAKSTTMPKGAGTQSINSLAQLAAQDEDIAAYLDLLKEQQPDY